MTLGDDRVTVGMSPRIGLPVIPRATKDEIERRWDLFAETMALRDETGLIGITTEELIRELRAGTDGE